MNCKKQHFETPSVFHFQIRNQCLISILLLSMAEWRIISHCHWHQIGTSLGRPFHPSSLLPCCLLGPSGPVSAYPGSGRTDRPRTRGGDDGRTKTSVRAVNRLYPWSAEASSSPPLSERTQTVQAPDRIALFCNIVFSNTLGTKSCLPKQQLRESLIGSQLSWV